MDRKSKIIKRLNLNGTGLELGPLCWPVVKKGESRIFYVDHMSTEDLKVKYENEKVPLDEIVEVDFVINNQSLSEVVGNKRFDYVIASHVIEHVPDIIRWLKDIDSVLRKDGILSLVIPDKRYTFDLERQDSTPGDVIGAYLENHTRASSAAMFDFASNYIKDVDAASIWNGDFRKACVRRYSPKDALEMCIQNLKPDKFVDSHCLVFTPKSFFEIVKILGELKLISFYVDSFTDTSENEYEFFVTLKKVSKFDLKTFQKHIPNTDRVQSENELLHIIKNQEDTIRRIQNSLSWRLTKPLRKVRSFVK